MVQSVKFSQVSWKFTTTELNKNAIRNVCNEKNWKRILIKHTLKRLDQISKKIQPLAIVFHSL